MIKGYLSIIVAAVGGAVLIAAIGLIAIRGLAPSDILLIGLTLPTGWLRVKLEPAGYITLAPVVVITALALAPPHVAIAVAALSAVGSAVLFGRHQLLQSFEDVSEETIPVILALASTGVLMSPHSDLGVPTLGPQFGLTILVYVLARVSLSAGRAKVLQGIDVGSFLFGAGRPIVLNLGFLALVAAGLSYLTKTYGSTGYFALTLATVALIESYHPFKLLSDQRDVLFASLSMVAQAIDLKDAYTGRHARAASEVAVRIARSLRLPEPEVRKIRIAGILHDIGKVGVSGKIIRKPGALDASEMAVMRQHPVIGAEIMRPVELLAEAAEIVHHHHEHYDGSGYPDGLGGDQIPIGSRIVLVADAFNAMTTDRPYRKARPKNEALQVLKKHSGKQFDPRVVGALESIVDLVETHRLDARRAP